MLAAIQSTITASRFSGRSEEHTSELQSQLNLVCRLLLVNKAMSMCVKSDKTFEEIVERLAALFKLKPRPGDRDYEETIDADPVTPPAPAGSSHYSDTQYK